MKPDDVLLDAARALAVSLPPAEAFLVTELVGLVEHYEDCLNQIVDGKTRTRYSGVPAEYLAAETLQERKGLR